MAAVPLYIDTIVSDPTIRGGMPIIAGTTLRVVDLVAYHIFGDKLTPEQLAVDFSLSLGQVYAALAYYHLHKEEIDAWYRADAERAEQLFNLLAAQGRASRLE
jgi:uncharacterized protein (DUF433 family)